MQGIVGMLYNNVWEQITEKPVFTTGRFDMSMIPELIVSIRALGISYSMGMVQEGVMHVYGPGHLGGSR